MQGRAVRGRRDACVSARSVGAAWARAFDRSFLGQRVSTAGAVSQHSKTDPKCQTHDAVVVHVVKSSLWAESRARPSQTCLPTQESGGRQRRHTSPAVAFVEDPGQSVVLSVRSACPISSLPSRRGPDSLPGPRRTLFTGEDEEVPAVVGYAPGARSGGDGR